MASNNLRVPTPSTLAVYSPMSKETCQRNQGGKEKRLTTITRQWELRSTFYISVWFSAVLSWFPTNNHCKELVYNTLREITHRMVCKLISPFQFNSPCETWQNLINVGLRHSQATFTEEDGTHQNTLLEITTTEVQQMLLDCKMSMCLPLHDMMVTIFNWFWNSVHRVRVHNILDTSKAQLLGHLDGPAADQWPLIDFLYYKMCNASMST